MKAPIRIGLPPGHRQLYIERWPGEFEVSDDADLDHIFAKLGQSWEYRAIKVPGFWLLPISTNPDRTLGIFLRLYDNGKIERVTVRATEMDQVDLIKPEDK